MRLWKISLILILFMPIRPAGCQTVGNGTVMAPSAGEREAYGLNSTPLPGGTGAFPTHHYRSESSGIGGSTVGTTSPTSESSPAVVVPQLVQTSAKQFQLPRLDSSFGESVGSPALVQFTPALPTAPRSNALVSPLSNSAFGSDFSNSHSLENLPSFSRRPSLMHQMQFDQFGK
jgi:hypothetical protein